MEYASNLTIVLDSMGAFFNSLKLKYNKSISLVDNLYVIIDKIQLGTVGFFVSSSDSNLE